MIRTLLNQIESPTPKTEVEKTVNHVLIQREHNYSKPSEQLVPNRYPLIYLTYLDLTTCRYMKTYKKVQTTQKFKRQNIKQVELLSITALE